MKVNQSDAEITGCTMPTKQGDPCGKPGQVGLPVGICPEHALGVYRAVKQLVDEQATREAARHAQGVDR
ncbi:hypothetical protein [Saccharomonospora cyanea]|uniref:Uncharacterized protein n=1 Tax=Saccharomonospora cyanea NA-134 TaxID=882082 RepID=H5XG62_9PSEU|nr:hypothetical protein [Saccharomonospora cyanea]EHR62644.1 hypothetical protein SaccyDRAFT_3817 [Saccharomonospora cyanea NA-134]